LSPAAAGLWEVGNPGTGGIVQRHYDENRERLTSFARGSCLCLKSTESFNQTCMSLATAAVRALARLPEFLCAVERPD